MKASQILYIFLFLLIVVFIIKSTDLLESEGFEDKAVQMPLLPKSDPIVPKGIEPTRTDIQAQPNSSIPGSLPFGPYAQQASVGSYQYQDPATMPADLKQMKQLYEDLQAFLVFEGVSVSNSSDPTVSLPLTQLRADSRKIQQEVAVLDKNPGIQSSLTQQDLADIQGALTFLQRKVRLFQSAGVVSDTKEGFQNPSGAGPKTRATKVELQTLQTKIYAAILVLSASGTTDPVVQSRIKVLQKMYSDTTDMINKLDKGLWTSSDVPVYKEDITMILPNLANPKVALTDLSKQGSGVNLSPIEKQLAGLVGEENASSVFKNIKDNGMFRLSLDLGYNVRGSNNDDEDADTIRVYSNNSGTGPLSGVLAGPMAGPMAAPMPMPAPSPMPGPLSSQKVDGPFDSTMSGMDDRSEIMQLGKGPSRLDWKKRAADICTQVKRRGLDPLDFGCIPDGSKMSPAYSWRGHTKMVCGRLGATLDPDLPRACGCPPTNWQGWNLSNCTQYTPMQPISSQKC